jgi:GT2 family glycosyltransferase
MELSIIIISYNTLNYLRECLQSLERFRDKGIEVFVVDNASIDGSPEMVTANFPWVTLIRNQQNRGFAAANNQAILQSAGRYIMLLNSDTIMLEGTEGKITSFMDQHPDIGVVGCKLLNTDGSLQPSITSFPNIIKDTLNIALINTVIKNTPVMRTWFSRIGKILGASASRFDDHAETKEIDFPRGACLTISRTALDQVGLLDENYFFSGEELDWCYRIKQKGWKVFYYHEAAIIHHDHGSIRGLSGKVFVQIRKSTLHFYQKHYGTLSTEVMKLLVSSVLLTKCVYISFCLIFKSSKRQQLLARREIYWATIRMYYDRNFRELNVFSEMPFRYN